VRAIEILIKKTRWGIAVCHRRAGKTVACVNDLIKAAATCEKNSPRFAYIAPQLNQAKDIAWSYLLEYTDCFGPRGRSMPQSCGLSFRTTALASAFTALTILTASGHLSRRRRSRRVRGHGPDGLDSGHSPALSIARAGPSFIGTPKGKNTFHTLWTLAHESDDWFTLMLKASETGCSTTSRADRRSPMMSEDEYAQEYECSFEAAVKGAYYGKEMNDAEGKILLASLACLTILACLCIRRGISASRTRRLSGSFRWSDAKPASSTCSRARASVSTGTLSAYLSETMCGATTISRMTSRCAS
jgi:phage terminase large subunit